MTNVKKLAVAAVTVFVAVLAACSDQRADKGVPTAPKLVYDANGSITMGTCTTYGDLNSLAAQIFGGNSDDFKEVHDNLKDLQEEVAQNHVTEAQKSARDIVDYVRRAVARHHVPGTPAQINAFIGGVLCYAGLSTDTFLVAPSPTTQVVTSTTGSSGISVPPNAVTEPTLITLTTIDPNAPSPLITKLDKYPSYVSITSTSTLGSPVVVAVCPTGVIPADVRARLRLGHQRTAGFAIEPEADGSFLPCAVSSAQSRLPGWLRTVASIVLPHPLYAAVSRRFGGGVGGSVSEFSPFGAVDPELEMRGGGVGGSITEFKRTAPKKPGLTDSTTGAATSLAPAGTGLPGTSGTTAFTVDGSGNCTAMSVTVGTPLEPGCRPFVTVTTHLGTLLLNVPVDWAVETGGGTIAPDAIATQTCGAFGATAATITDALAKAGICWTLGPNGGSNTVTAIPRAGAHGPAVHRDGPQDHTDGICHGRYVHI